MSTVTIGGKDFEFDGSFVHGLEDGFNVSFDESAQYEEEMWEAAYITECVCIRSKPCDSPGDAWDNLMHKIGRSLDDLAVAALVKL